MATEFVLLKLHHYSKENCTWDPVELFVKIRPFSLSHTNFKWEAKFNSLLCRPDACCWTSLGVTAAQCQAQMSTDSVHNISYALCRKLRLLSLSDDYFGLHRGCYVDSELLQGCLCSNHSFVLEWNSEIPPNTLFAANELLCACLLTSSRYHDGIIFDFSVLHFLL